MIATNHLNFTVYVEKDHIGAFREAVASKPMVTGIAEHECALHIRVELLADDVFEAAIFLATISADPERAAMFKMFWSGE